MENLTTHWRPHPKIRAKALAVIFRGDSLLLCAIPDDSGAIKGWRPLGGTIEHGEYAKDTVARELSEELFATCTVGRQLGVVENIYEHQGVSGHEIVFLFDVTLTNDGLARADEFVVEDGGTRLACAWVPLARFHAGQAVLFPTGLLELL